MGGYRFPQGALTEMDNRSEDNSTSKSNKAEQESAWVADMRDEPGSSSSPSQEASKSLGKDPSRREEQGRGFTDPESFEALQRSEMARSNPLQDEATAERGKIIFKIGINRNKADGSIEAFPELEKGKNLAEGPNDSNTTLDRMKKSDPNLDYILFNPGTVFDDKNLWNKTNGTLVPTERLDGNGSKEKKPRDEVQVAESSAPTKPDNKSGGRIPVDSRPGGEKPGERKPADPIPADLKPSESKPKKEPAVTRLDEQSPEKAKPGQKGPEAPATKTPVENKTVPPKESVAPPKDNTPPKDNPPRTDTVAPPDTLPPKDKVSPNDQVAPPKDVVEPFKPIPVLSADRFPAVARDVLKQINPDGAPVTKEQLAKAMENPAFKGEQAQALAAMYKGYDQLHNLSGSDSFFSKKGITGEDVDKYPAAVKEQEAKVTDIYSTKFWADNNLKRFAGPDGVLKKSDIEKALADANVSATDKTHLQKLNKLVDEIGTNPNWIGGEKGLNKEAIAKHASSILNEGDGAKLVNTMSYAMSRTADARSESGGNRDLYPPDGIKPDAVKQGMIGNCYFVSALASMAKSNPEAIRNMIKDNKDGTYTVTFPGAKNEPITVKAPTEAEMGLYNNSSQNGLWASVMEKAYGQYRDNHAWIGSYTPQEAADGGGRPEKVLALLSGKEAKELDLYNEKNDQNAVRQFLSDAFSSNPPKAVTANSRLEWQGWFSGGWKTEGDTADGFVRRHAFSIVGFTPDDKNGGTVTIRNPWGGKDNSTSGTISIPLNVFMKNFGEIASHS